MKTYMNILKKPFLILILVVISASGISQMDSILLNNPGFEDKPKMGGMTNESIKGWGDCGKIKFPSETPPDIHPNGFWEVNNKAIEGKTYLGMVARDNGTFEFVGQKLKTSLMKGQKYEFSFFLAKAKIYTSRSRTTGNIVYYNMPIVFRILGGESYCEVKEKLHETQPVDHHDWKKYVVIIEPKRDIHYIAIQAYFKSGTIMPYNGNILVDGLSSIYKIAE